jgi:hypothetical protein
MSILITDLKQRIWKQAKQDLARVEAAKEAAGTNDNSEKYWRAVLQQLKRKRPPKPVLSPAHKQRYIDAHRSFQDREYPNAVKDHGYLVTDIPNTAEANGLTKFVVQFLTWSGHFANRTGNEGRVIKDKDGETKRIKSSSINGMQDIDTNIKHPLHPYGIPWKIEIKVGRDTHKDHQKDFGKLVSKTGGKYSVVRSVEDFFSQYDALFQQKTLF